MKKVLGYFLSGSGLLALALLFPQLAVAGAVPDANAVATTVTTQAKGIGALIVVIAGLIGLVFVVVGLVKWSTGGQRQEGIGGPVKFILFGVLLMSPYLISEILTKSTVGDTAQMQKF
ncbi:MAG: hypothetical protein IBX55_00040 [Methyloprofundus sp.]|nr:hypothetical protein [Methyloprofundus sp.]